MLHLNSNCPPTPPITPRMQIKAPGSLTAYSRQASEPRLGGQASWTAENGYMPAVTRSLSNTVTPQQATQLRVQVSVQPPSPKDSMSYPVLNGRSQTASNDMSCYVDSTSNAGCPVSQPAFWDQPPSTFQLAPAPPPSSSVGWEDQAMKDEDSLSDLGDDDQTGGRSAMSALERREQKKRFRLNHKETSFLLSEFAKHQHPSLAHREYISRQVKGLTPRQVQVWFQNRRAKMKRLTSADRESVIKSRALPPGFDMTEVLHRATPAAPRLDQPNGPQLRADDKHSTPDIVTTYVRFDGAPPFPSSARSTLPTPQTASMSLTPGSMISDKSSNAAFASPSYLLGTPDGQWGAPPSYRTTPYLNTPTYPSTPMYDAPRHAPRSAGLAGLTYPDEIASWGLPSTFPMSTVTQYASNTPATTPNLKKGRSSMSPPSTYPLDQRRGSVSFKAGGRNGAQGFQDVENVTPLPAGYQAYGLY